MDLGEGGAGQFSVVFHEVVELDVAGAEVDVVGRRTWYGNLFLKFWTLGGARTRKMEIY